MIVNNLSSILFKVGFLEIKFYGIVYALGFILTYYFLNKNRKKLGVTREQADNLIIFSVLGLIVGARLAYFLFHNPIILIEDPLELFRIWHGGMSFFGGLAGSFIVAFFYLRSQNLKFFCFGDIVVIPATIALIFGRIANFVNNELVGTVSNVPWCVVFPKFDNLCRHPYQLYASFSHLLLLIILIITATTKRKKNLKNGVVFSTFFIFYGLFRLITDFFREDPHYAYLTTSQYASIILVIIGLCILLKLKKKTKK